MAGLDKLRKTHTKLSKKYGKDAVFRKLNVAGAQVYDENTGLFSAAPAFTDYPVKITPLKSISYKLSNRLEDSQLFIGDLECQVSAQQIEGIRPEPNDELIAGDQVFKVIGVNRQDSGEQTAYFTLFVRGS